MFYFLLYFFIVKPNIIKSFFLGYIWFLEILKGKYEEKKIERKSERKEKVKENKK